MTKIRIGSRKSILAIKQSELVKAELQKKGLSNVEIIPFDTSGDRNQEECLSVIGGKGVFTEEIEKSLQKKEIDIAVHSLKDLPVVLSSPFFLSGVLPREDPRDAFLSCHYTSIDDIPYGGVIATSSVRRRAFLLSYRPDLLCVPIRGNVQTRFNKCMIGTIDGTIMAVSGLKRCNMESHIQSILPYSVMIPSPGQGAIAMETLKDSPIHEVVTCINHSKTWQETSCERTLLSLIGGGCHTPFGALATIQQDTIELQACIVSVDGKIKCETIQNGLAKEWKKVAKKAFKDLCNKGLNTILQEMENNATK
ncbi:MAG: hydroxymethylbilane synthase [Caldisericia bacterium]|nr:hydroxymethylbilane synthase [Caldisericia bacterium]